MANDNALARTAPTMTTTALAAPVDPRAAIAARNPEDVQRMADAIAKSGLYGVKSREEAMIRMATGMELGLSPMQSIRGVYVISSGGVSRPTLSADMMVGGCKMRTDLCRYFRLVESTDRRATYETHRVGDPEPVRMSYTMEQAQRAGLAGRGTWQAHPEAMLRARAASSLARAVDQDLLNGLYDPDELVEAQPAHHAPVQAQTAPVVAHVVEAVPEPVSQAAVLFERIESARSLAELAEVARAIKAADVAPEERDYLRAAYSDRQKALRPVPAPAPVAEADAAPEEG